MWSLFYSYGFIVSNTSDRPKSVPFSTKYLLLNIRYTTENTILPFFHSIRSHLAPTVNTQIAYILHNSDPTICILKIVQVLFEYKLFHMFMPQWFAEHSEWSPNGLQITFRWSVEYFRVETVCRIINVLILLNEISPVAC